MSKFSKFEESYQKLNSEQKQAVDFIDGPFMAVAGPGTGKTQILALRVVNILKQTDTLPNHIVCLTFTDSARENLRQRLISFLGRDGHRVKINTFHGLAVEIISEYPEYFFSGADFSPLEEIEQTQILDSILEDLDLTSPLKSHHPDQGWTYAESILDNIKQLKENSITPSTFKQILKINQKQFEIINQTFLDFISQEEFPTRFSKKNLFILQDLLEKMKDKLSNQPQFEQEFLEQKNIKSYTKLFLEKLQKAIEDCLEQGKSSPFTEFKNLFFKKDKTGSLVLKDSLNQEKLDTLALIYEKYQNALYNSRYYDFQDMILQVLKAIKEYPELRYNLQESCHYLLIDEFQDTNLAQLEMSQLLLNPEINEGMPNIFIVGDDDQSICKFQGANLDNLLSFEKTYKNVKSVFLTKNYRSKSDILSFAQKVIKQSQVRLCDILKVDKNLIAMN